MRILCSISTRGRYDSTLPMAIQSVITQKKKPDHLVIFDDNDNPIDIRENKTYFYLLHMLNESGISWEVIYGQKKGQHYNHQMANEMGFDWVWRLDDDTVADSNVLEVLSSYIDDDIGAIGGSILTPPLIKFEEPTGLIENISNEPNIQWYHINKVKEVHHLHCSFLYRAGVNDYNLGLSKVAHREETLFTYELFQKGYKILVVPNAITWHLKNDVGGIRSHKDESLYSNDERIFRNHLNVGDRTLIVLNCGMGDHVVFKNVLEDIKNPLVFSCYPEIIPGESIADAMNYFGDIERFNVYKKMDKWKWTDSLENAFRKLYGVEK